MFITSSYCISPQPTFNLEFLNGEKVEIENKVFARCIHPDYKSIIPRGLLRRMGTALKMGVFAGLKLVENNPVDGIIMGTADGGIEDSMKFLKHLTEFEEGVLSPTSFVQSTPNAIAGNIALLTKNTGFSNTHVNKGLAFESALLEAFLLIKSKDLESLLVGAVEQISEDKHELDVKTGLYKSDIREKNKQIYGEGAALFTVNSTPTQNSVRVVDIGQITTTNTQSVNAYLSHFLKLNNLVFSDLDGVVCGSDMLELPKGLAIYNHKILVGEYATSSGFALWLAIQALNSAYKLFPVSKGRLLIINSFKGKQHGFIIVEKV